jgi:hypothetical protein
VIGGTGFGSLYGAKFNKKAVEKWRLVHRTAYEITRPNLKNVSIVQHRKTLV